MFSVLSKLNSVQSEHWAEVMTKLLLLQQVPNSGENVNEILANLSRTMNWGQTEAATEAIATQQNWYKVTSMTLMTSIT